MRKPFRRTAAIAALVLALSGMTAVAANAKSDKDTEKAAAADETSDTTEETTAAEEQDGQEEIVVQDWDKADISAYDSSLTLVSYEPATPEMSAAAETAEKPQLTDEEKSAILTGLRKGLPTLIKSNGRNVEPTEVELYTSGAEVGEVPAPQTADVETRPGEFAFVTYGWGHGVGMSQNGANFYASYAGWTYQDILYHYYPGTYLMNTGLTNVEQLTIAHQPAGDTLDVVASIVNAEVGGGMAYEAIKAQAVAVYTYIKYNGDDSNDLRGKPNPPQNVIDACREVLGEALYYDGYYANSMFSASSGGCSANCYEVFYADIPYLRSVSSDYDAGFDPHYGTVTYMSEDYVRSKIQAAYGITLSNDPSTWIQPEYSAETGYATYVTIDGQVTVKAYQFTQMMGLKSCKFNMTYTYDVPEYEEVIEPATTPADGGSTESATGTAAQLTEASAADTATETQTAE